MDEIKNKLQLPAIGLLIVGILNGAGGFLSLLSGLMRLTGLGRQDNYYVADNDAQAFGMMVSTFLIYGVSFLSLILSPVIIYGSIQMMKVKRLSLAKAASGLAILPITACCFILGIPIGAWCLYVLSRPEVKAEFNRTIASNNYNPPQPPSF